MKRNFTPSIIFSFLILISCQNDDSGSVLKGSQTGTGGSMARFALGPNNLYVVNDEILNVYHIDKDGSLTFIQKRQLNVFVETITVRGDQLFLGTNAAMYIYSIVEPDNPSFVSYYEHIRACDPVVVSGNYAYVTLRINASCRSAGTDALEVIDISNPLTPLLVKSYPVSTPYGLGVDGNVLFLCQGDNGLRIFNIEDPNNMVEIKHYGDIHAYDVIPNKGVLIMTGNDGIFQYDYTNLSDIHLLSHIETK